MSQHGQIILKRMLEIIDQYEAGRTDLRRVVDELGVMYQSLDAAEQPPERQWADAILPLDRMQPGAQGRQRQMLDSRISDRVAELKRLIRQCQPPEGLAAGQR